MSISSSAADNERGAFVEASGLTGVPAMRVVNPDGSFITGGTVYQNVSVDGVYNSTPPTLTNTQASPLQLDVNGRLITTPRPVRATPTETTPSVATATSVQLLAANATRSYLLIQNNSAADIMVSLSGNTLTGIAPTATNKGIVLKPGASYDNPAHYVTNSAVTCYQTSGSTINTIYVLEG